MEVPEVLARRLEEAIVRISGVESVRVVMDADGAVSEVHLVGPQERPPKGIVRDTETLLRVRFGLGVDYRKISVVQLPKEEGERFVRPKLLSVECDADGEIIAVMLQGSNGQVNGTHALIGQGDDALVRGGAEATLAAVSKATNIPASLHVRDARIFQTNECRVVVVVVAAEKDGVREQLTGTCVVGESLPTTTAKATLDAINRRLEFWSLVR